MHLTESHAVPRNSPLFKDLDIKSFDSKNVYNSVIYIMVQIQTQNKDRYEKGLELLRYPTWQNIVKEMTKNKNEAFYEMGNTKLSQNTVKDAVNDWTNYLKARKAYFRNPSKFNGEPKRPKYKHPIKGRSKIICNPQTLQRKYLKKSEIKTTFMSISVPFSKNKKGGNAKIKEVHIVPQKNHYQVNIIYEVKPTDMINPDVNGEFHVMGIDPGVNNVFACAITNGTGVLFDGALLKYINRNSNKEIAKAQKELPKDQFSSKKTESIWKNRKNRIKDVSHKLTREAIDLAIENNVDTIVVGKNLNWKKNVTMWKNDKQNFVYIPFNMIIEQLAYKAKLVGIEVILTEESYTSKASSIDRDQLFSYGYKPVNHKFSGYRKKRGLYVSKKSKLHMNADMNGAVNILRKVALVDEDSPSYETWVRGCVVAPVKRKISLSG